MSANLYTIQDLLIGKIYRSNSIVGEIVEAQPHPKSVYYSNATPYLVRVRGEGANYQFRTIAVKDNE